MITTILSSGAVAEPYSIVRSTLEVEVFSANIYISSQAEVPATAVWMVTVEAVEVPVTLIAFQFELPESLFFVKDCGINNKS